MTEPRHRAPDPSSTPPPGAPDFEFPEPVSPGTPVFPGTAGAPGTGTPVESPVLDAGAVTGDAAPPAGHRGPGRPKQTGKGSFWRELPVLVVIAIVLAVIIKTFLVQAFFIPSGSMERTLMVGDRVLVNKLVYDFRDPRRGEIVVFNGKKACEGTPAAAPAKPCTWPSVNANEGLSTSSNGIAKAIRSVQNFIGLGGGNDHDFIKRVIAVGGDTVSCPATSDNSSYCDKVMVNGVALDESSYVFDDDHQVFAPVVVPKGDLYVMGDHRGNSQDSRYNGTISVNSVVGRAFVTVWPVGRIGGHSIPKDFKQPLPQAKPAS